MIAEAISRIEEKESMENVALKYHIPDNAIYVIVDKDFSYKIISKERFSFNSKFVAMDFYSRIINLNKALDKKKLITSNNYLTFFCSNFEKLTEKIIDNYYSRAQTPEESLIYRDWIKENIFKIYEEVRQENKKGKIKIKVFFKADLKEYIKLNNLYLEQFALSNVEEFDKELFGNSSFINLNNKKPFLKTYSRKITNPYAINMGEGIKHKYFADMLYSFLRRRKTLLYILEDGTLIPLDLASGEVAERDIINGLIISFGLNSRGNLIINHMDSVARYNYYLK